MCISVCVCVKMSVSCPRGGNCAVMWVALRRCSFFPPYMAQYGVSSVCRGPTVNSVYDAQKQHLQRAQRGTNTDRGEGSERERERLKRRLGTISLGNCRGNKALINRTRLTTCSCRASVHLLRDSQLTLAAASSTPTASCWLSQSQYCRFEETSNNFSHLTSGA